MSRPARVFLAAALFSLGLAASPDLAPVAAAQQAVPASLDAAYQKEYAYLQAEKAALTARLQEVQAQEQRTIQGGLVSQLCGLRKVFKVHGSRTTMKYKGKVIGIRVRCITGNHKE